MLHVQIKRIFFIASILKIKTMKFQELVIKTATFRRKNISEAISPQ